MITGRELVERYYSENEEQREFAKKVKHVIRNAKILNSFGKTAKRKELSPEDVHNIAKVSRLKSIKTIKNPETHIIAKHNAEGWRDMDLNNAKAIFEDGGYYSKHAPTKF